MKSSLGIQKERYNLTDKEAKQTLFNNKKEDIDDAHLKLKKLEG